MATLVSRNEFNVYESADARFEAAARKLNLEEGLYRFLKYPNKEITVYIPVMLITATWRCLSAIASIIRSCAGRAREESLRTERDTR